MVRLEPYPPQFLKFGHVSPAPLQTMIEKNKIMILCSICTLIFVSGGKGGCRACHMHLCQLRSPRGGRLDGTSACHSEGSIFGPEKVRASLWSSWYRATFLTSRTDYRWRFDSPAGPQVSLKSVVTRRKPDWRRPQKKMGPKKSRKIRHANAGLPSSRFLPRMLFVLK